MMAKRALITGAGGFIGRALMERLRTAGHHVVGIDDLSAPGSQLGPSVAFRRVEDLTLGDLAGLDSVVHLAAAKRVDASFRDLDAVGRNVCADAHLIQVAYASQVPQVLFASTCEVYGASSHASNSESHSPAPVSPYAVGKLASEQLLLSTSDLHPRTRVTILRLFNVYGATEAPPALVPAFLAARQAGQPLTIQGSGAQARDFSHIDDSVEMIAELFLRREVPAVINVGSGHATTVNAVAEHVRALGPDPCEIRFGPPRVNEIGFLRSDTRLWQRELGPVSTRPFADGLRECWEAFEAKRPVRQASPQNRSGPPRMGHELLSKASGSAQSRGASIIGGSRRRAPERALSNDEETAVPITTRNG